MEKMLDKLLNWLANAGTNLLKGILLLVIGLYVIKFITSVLERKKISKKIDMSAYTFIISFTNITLKIVLLFSVASIMGLPTTSTVTLIGSAGVAIGLALQGGLSNIVGGLTVLIFKPFKAGDYVKIGSAAEGNVKSISIFYTVLVTADNKQVTLPNGDVANSVIVDYSANAIRRLDLTFGASYDDDVKKVKKVIVDVINKNEFVLKNKDVTVRLTEHGDSALKYAVKVWVNKEDYWETYYSLQEEVEEAFRKNKITIPYPQMDIHYGEK